MFLNHDNLISKLDIRRVYYDTGSLRLSEVIHLPTNAHKTLIEIKERDSFDSISLTKKISQYEKLKGKNIFKIYYWSLHKVKRPHDSYSLISIVGDFITIGMEEWIRKKKEKGQNVTSFQFYKFAIGLCEAWKELGGFDGDFSNIGLENCAIGKENIKVIAQKFLHDLFKKESLQVEKKPVIKKLSSYQQLPKLDKPISLNASPAKDQPEKYKLMANKLPKGSPSKFLLEKKNATLPPTQNLPQRSNRRLSNLKTDKTSAPNNFLLELKSPEKERKVFDLFAKSLDNEIPKEIEKISLENLQNIESIEKSVENMENIEKSVEKEENSTINARKIDLLGDIFAKRLEESAKKMENLKEPEEKIESFEDLAINDKEVNKSKKIEKNLTEVLINKSSLNSRVLHRMNSENRIRKSVKNFWISKDSKQNENENENEETPKLDKEIKEIEPKFFKRRRSTKNIIDNFENTEKNYGKLDSQKDLVYYLGILLLQICRLETNAKYFEELSSQKLQDVLREVGLAYGKDISKVLFKMLNMNVVSRPGVAEIERYFECAMPITSLKKESLINREMKFTLMKHFEIDPKKLCVWGDKDKGGEGWIYFLEENGKKIYVLKIFGNEKSNEINYNLFSVTLKIDLVFPSSCILFPIPVKKKTQLYLGGGDNSNHFYFVDLPNKKLVEKEGLAANFERKLFGWCVLPNEMVICSGYVDLILSESCEIFNAYKETWQKVSDVNKPVLEPLLIQHNEKFVYKFGGIEIVNNIRKSCYCIEKYDIMKNNWEIIHFKLNQEKRDESLFFLKNMTGVQINPVQFFIFGGQKQDEDLYKQSFIFGAYINQEEEENQYYEISNINSFNWPGQFSFEGKSAIIGENLWSLAKEEEKFCLVGFGKNGFMKKITFENMENIKNE